MYVERRVDWYIERICTLSTSNRTNQPYFCPTSPTSFEFWREIQNFKKFTTIILEVGPFNPPCETCTIPPALVRKRDGSLLAVRFFLNLAPWSRREQPAGDRRITSAYSGPGAIHRAITHRDPSRRSGVMTRGRDVAMVMGQTDLLQSTAPPGPDSFS